MNLHGCCSVQKGRWFKVAEISQFGGGAQGESPNRDCLELEAMLADVLDGALSPEEQARFDRHAVGCNGCAAMLADAQRGAAWLEMLRRHPPQPPADLVNRILATTSVRSAIGPALALQPEPVASAGGALSEPWRPAFAASAADASAFAIASSPSVSRGRLLPFRARLRETVGPTLGALLQTRMAMTAAMAFFSVALTLNLLGAHVTALRARDLRPSSLRRNVSEANAHVIRYYESLRVVYELESRVRDLQHNGDSEPPRSLDPAPDSARPSSNDPQRAQPPDRTPPKAAPSRDPGSSSTSGTHGAPAPAGTRLARRPLPTTDLPGTTLPVSYRGGNLHWRGGSVA